MISGKQQKQQPQESSPENKEAAKACLHNADKLLKDGEFEKAKEQISNAKNLDPSNPYIYAFQDRIEYFEQLKKKETAQAKPAPPSEPRATPKPASPRPPAPVVAPAEPVDKTPTWTPPPLPKEEAHAPAPIFQITPQGTVSREHAKPTEAVMPKFTPPPAPTPERKQAAIIGEEERLARQESESMLLQMKRQIEELSKALEQEKRVREEISLRQLQGAVEQFRNELEKAWMNGAPPEKEAQELHRLAVSLGIPQDVEQNTARDVKLDMYSKAVKEMIAKRKLLKNSSATMEWLRKVYQVSLTEYLENESRFLMDLVADQFKGTMLFVSSDAHAKTALLPKLKMAGYAVVQVPNPETALEKIEKINPNIVLCDAEFPDANLSGVKFLHVLRVNSKFNFLPFIILCDTKEIAQVQSSELKPNEGIVKKPIDFDELSSVMNEKLAHFREYLSSI